jgi:predicted nucleotidyltransferase
VNDSAAIRNLSSLRPNERAALAAFVERLHARYGDDLQRVVLFGSKARGDFDAESDLDVLVVVRTAPRAYPQCWDEIADIAWQVESDFGVVTSLVIKNADDYALMRNHQLLLARNIEQGGIELWTTAPSATISTRASPELVTIS